MKEKSATLARLLGYITHYRLLLVLSILSAAAVVALTLYLPAALGAAIDGITGAGEVSFGTVTRNLIFAAAAVILTAVLQWIMNVINNRLTYGVARDVRRDAGKKLMRLPISYTDSRAEGDIVSCVITDTDQFTDGLLMGFTQLFTGVLTVAGTVGFMLAINLKIAAAVIVFTPMSLFVARFIATRTYKMFRAQSEARGEQTAFTGEMVENQKTVRAFGYENQAMKRFDEINERLSRLSLSAVFYSSLVNPSTRLVNNLIYAAVALFGSLAVIGSGGITIGSLSCLLAYATQYAKPFNEISGVVTELQGSLASARRVFELLDAPEQPDLGRKQPENVHGDVTFEHVSFSYVPEHPLIRDLNLSLKAGQKTAIVGATGCGKTTLINLLMRFREPDSGRLLLDGTDIRDIPVQKLRRCYGMVLQDTYLFNTTIRENIAFGKPDATDEEIVAAAKAAHADSFIRRLPAGYASVIGDGGVMLSQGQKQLLAIARVMAALPPMLILDEATSSIDTRTEIKIQDAFRKMTEGRTSFIVAHRLSTIRDADLILYMENGSVREAGTHDELLALGGGYAKLYMSQFS